MRLKLEKGIVQGLIINYLKTKKLSILKKAFFNPSEKNW